jgi:3-oxo-5alpha-steroid 4-dehydrogenase
VRRSWQRIAKPETKRVQLMPTSTHASESSPDTSDSTETGWDEVVDVVVVGFGGAGASAAIESANSGAKTLVIDRFGGGGATRMSGGIYYAGGGTDLQREAGYEDSPDELFEYLRCETDGEAVSDEVLRAFCDASIDNFEWLRSRGVPFPVQGFPPIKTSYPSDETTLYYSGNEKSPPYSDRATPAPRGHRPLGKGLTGKILYEPLRRATLEAGAEIRYRTRAIGIVKDSDGRVIGIESQTLFPSRAVRIMHGLLYAGASYLGAMNEPALRFFRRWIERLESSCSRPIRIRAQGGVVLSAGGFIFNPEWTRKYLPTYSKTMRLGTVGDDGSGIALGLGAGAGVRKMERGTAWMFINPPAGLPKGILLNRSGERICNEELYGAALGERIAEFHDGRAILLLDHRAWKDARDQIFRERKATFQTLMGLINLYLNNTRAETLEELESRLGFPATSIRASVRRYNDNVAAGKDELGKSEEYMRPLEVPPFYAVDCDIDNGRFLTPSITLGGLDIDGLTSQVRSESGAPIPGLYAAGRNAVGICSQHYVSGLSLADCVFSGRNAGRNAARAGRGGRSDPVA